jgi:hypothetical protein
VKKVIFVFTFYAIILSLGISADIEKADITKIEGSWINANLYYSFDTKGVMKTIKIDSHPLTYQTDRYELIAMGDYELVRYGKDLSDSATVKFLLVTGMTDSSALFAYGIPFARADSVNGLKGVWKHVDNSSLILWNIGSNTIDYIQSELDYDTGELITVEEHHGTFARGGVMDEPGRFYIDFQDGKKAVVLPILFKDIMYMFDLNPSRTRFILTESAPTYRDYTEALKKSR